MEKSAIMQMFLGERGTGEQIKLSEKYRELLGRLVLLDQELRGKLKEYPDLLALYERMEEVEMEKEAEAMDIYYQEGFSFGLVLGVEAGMR